MIYSSRYVYKDTYEYVSINQHGTRYKLGKPKKLNVLKMEANVKNADDLARLIFISSHLRIPIEWDCKSTPQKAWIEITHPF